MDIDTILIIVAYFLGCACMVIGGWMSSRYRLSIRMVGIIVLATGGVGVIWALRKQWTEAPEWLNILLMGFVGIMMLYQLLTHKPEQSKQEQEQEHNATEY